MEHFQMMTSIYINQMFLINNIKSHVKIVTHIISSKLVNYTKVIFGIQTKEDVLTTILHNTSCSLHSLLNIWATYSLAAIQK